MKQAEEQENAVREAVLESSKEIGKFLSDVADTSEEVFGIRPNEMGMRVLGAMFAGKPLAPLLNIESNQVEATFEVARAKVKAGDLHGAVKLLRILVMIDFYNKRHWLMLALSLQKLGLWASAGDSYCMAHVVDTSDLWPVVRAIECYLEAEDPTNATDLLEILKSLMTSEGQEANVDDMSSATEKLEEELAALRAESASAVASA